MNQYATDFGILFQIVDDLIDFGGNSDDYGKTTGYDYLNGLITLPIMNAIKYQESNHASSEILSAFNQSNRDFLCHQLKDSVQASNAIETTLNTVSELEIKCATHLEAFETSLGKDILQSLVSYTISRIPKNLLSAKSN